MNSNSNTGFTGFSGYGVNPEKEKQRMDQLALAKMMAALPNTELAEEKTMMGMPKGQMLGDVYVPPAFTQQAASMAHRMDGKDVLSDAYDQRQKLIAAIDEMINGYSPPEFPGMPPVSSRKPIAP